MKDSEKNRELKKFGLFAVILGDLIGFTGAGIALGYFIIKKFKGPWWIVLLTATGGLVLAFYQLYRLMRKEDQ